MHLFDALTDWLLAASGSPIALVVVFCCTVADSFFPPIPSESLVVSLASLSVTSGSPSLLALFPVAASAAIIGDNIAYLIGRRLGSAGLRVLRRPRVAAVMDRAGEGLRNRGAMVILTGRFIPVGRIAVNLAAGATGFPRRTFVGLSALAGTLWAGYSISIGLLAGRWVADNPLLGTVVAIAGAMLLGWVIEFVRTRIARRRGGDVRQGPGQATEGAVAEGDRPVGPGQVGTGLGLARGAGP